MNTNFGDKFFTKFSEKGFSPKLGVIFGDHQINEGYTTNLIKIGWFPRKCYNLSEKIWVAVDCRRHRNKETGTQLTVIYIATNITGLKYI